MAKSKKKLQDFQHDEIYNELRLREGEHDDLNKKRNRPLADHESIALHKELQGKQKLVYGVDDRLDIYQVVNQLHRGQAESVAGILDMSRVVDNSDGTSTIRTIPFSIAQDLCSDEKFFNQPTAPYCSAFLVAKDIVATAGHCIDKNNLAMARFIFGFHMINKEEARTRIANDNIFRGVAILDRKLENSDSDYALVKLDRPVLGRKILTVRQEGKIKDNTKVYVIGHPSGLPMKFANGARVLGNSKTEFFSANLDTYGGNSGSPVFNEITGHVEGILVRGATDFVTVGNCRRSNVLPTTGVKGEDVTRSSEFSAKIPDATNEGNSTLDDRVTLLEKSLVQIADDVKRINEMLNA